MRKPKNSTVKSMWRKGWGIKLLVKSVAMKPIGEIQKPDLLYRPKYSQKNRYNYLYYIHSEIKQTISQPLFWGLLPLAKESR